MIKSEQSSIFSITKTALTLFGVFLGMFAVTIVCAACVTHFFGENQRESLLFISAIQDVLLFALPAILMAYIVTAKDAWQLLGISEGFSMIAIGGAILAFFMGLPALNQIVAYNAEIKIPDASLETLFREWEASAAATTTVLLDTTSVGGLVSGILIVGIATGLCEELFFRGCLQRLMVYFKVNSHIAVWSAACVFSLAHFQFYGFFPRLLLGAFFGYLLLWTNSIWVPAICHALNNSLVVIFTWVKNRGITVGNIDEIGVSSGFPLIALLSAFCVIIFLTIGRKSIFAPIKHKGNG